MEWTIFQTGLEQRNQRFETHILRLSLPRGKNGGQGEEASVGHFVISGEAPIDDPIQKCRNVRIKLQQEHDRSLSQSVNLKIISTDEL